MGLSMGQVKLMSGSMHRGSLPLAICLEALYNNILGCCTCSLYVIG